MNEQILELMKEKEQKPKSDLLSRKGKIYIDDGVLRGNPDLILRSFQKLEFFPSRVEFLFAQNRFEMIGYSPLFEAIPDYAVTPTYDIHFHTNEAGDIVGVSAVQVDAPC